jgi:hypothetical protein
LNQRLMELFESQVDFEGWDYDVDRGWFSMVEGHLLFEDRLDL